MCKTPSRICVVYGSESGTAERGIRAICKKWRATAGCNFEVGAIMEGQAAAKIGLEALGDSYDFLVFATSSNGEGDPPSNFHAMLSALYRAVDDGSKPLAKCRHAVLGYGCSHFDTFQNCPRLTDKLLGECGSTRAAMRAEIDDIDEAGGDELVKAWSSAVFEVLRGGAAAAPTKDVCAWSEPDSTLLDKHDEMLVAAASAGDALPFLVLGALAAAGVAAYVAKFTNVFAAAEAA